MKTIQETYNIENKIRDKMDQKLGYVLSYQLWHNVKNKYDAKHKIPELITPKSINPKEFKILLEFYEAKRIYILGRYLSMWYNIGKDSA